jgi:hypothetical protein
MAKKKWECWRSIHPDDQDGLPWIIGIRGVVNIVLAYCETKEDADYIVERLNK